MHNAGRLFQHPLSAAVALALAVGLVPRPAAAFYHPATAFHTEDLGTLGGAGSRAYALAYDANNRLQVVGEAQIANGDWHAFRWRDLNTNLHVDAGEMTDLGTLGGRQSAARSVNSQGLVVGWSSDAAGRARAVQWSNSSAIQALGTIADPSEAAGINALGEVVGSYVSNQRFAGDGSTPHPRISALRLPPSAARPLTSTTPGRSWVPSSCKTAIPGVSSTPRPGSSSFLRWALTEAPPTL